MTILEQKITLKSSCDLIGKNKDIFSPVKEAITNSLDAISQRKNIDKNFHPLTSILFYFKTKHNVLREKSYFLDCIQIEDNGIGFTSENLSRFKCLANNTKGLNNRGTGKIQIFHRFEKVSIDSIFFENGKWNNLNAEWELAGEYKDKLTDIGEQKDRKTIVKMSKLNENEKEINFFVRYIDNISELKKDVLKHFLLRLWLGNISGTLNVELKIYLDGAEKDAFIFNKDNIPAPDKEEKVFVSTERALFSKDNDKNKIEWVPVNTKNELTIQRFKLPSCDLDENGIYMCSKNIVVEQFNFPAIKRKDANFSGFRYLSCIRGDILDKPFNVSHSVDRFTFPTKKETEDDLKKGNISLLNQKNEYIFWDEIKHKIGHGLSQVYADVEGLKEERDKDIAALAEQYGISIEDAEASNIYFNDTEEEATEKMFATQARRFAKQSIEIQKTYEELKILETKKLNPNDDQYRTKLKELSDKLLEKIPQQNKDELGRYIIRRDMVVHLLKLALNNELEVQEAWKNKKENREEHNRTEPEHIIHNLIFKRRMRGVPNDLWILNEEFVHFDGCSDLELNQLEINGEKLLRSDIDIDTALKNIGIEKGGALQWKPDIFLYPEEGKCILIEFKAPNVEMSKHCDQIQKYAKIIANYSTKKFVQFYGFLIGEQINKLSVPDRYQLVPYGNYWVYPNEPINSIETGVRIADLYQEIIPLSEIAKRAEIRNKSFAEKLGIIQKP